MTTAGWPFPGDGPTARARRVAQAYRTALHQADPAACDVLDQRMLAMGQGWVAPSVVTHDLDEWVPPAVAAELVSVQPATLREWRRRKRLTGRQRGGKWEYRVRDVLALATQPRRRGTM